MKSKELEIVNKVHIKGFNSQIVDQSDRVIWVCKSRIFVILKKELFAAHAEEEKLAPKEILDLGRTYRFLLSDMGAKDGVKEYKKIGSEVEYFYKKVDCLGEYRVKIGEEGESIENIEEGEVEDSFKVQEIEEILGEEILFGGEVSKTEHLETSEDDLEQNSKNSKSKEKQNSENHEESTIRKTPNKDQKSADFKPSKTKDNLKSVRIYLKNNEEHSNQEIEKSWETGLLPDYYQEKGTLHVLNQNTWNMMRIKGKRVINRSSSSIRNWKSFNGKMYNKQFGKKEQTEDTERKSLLFEKDGLKKVKLRASKEILQYGKFGSAVFVSASNEVISLGGIDQDRFLKIIRQEEVKDLDLCNFVFSCDHVYWVPPNHVPRIHGCVFENGNNIFICGGVEVYTSQKGIYSKYYTSNLSITFVSQLSYFI